MEVQIKIKSAAQCVEDFTLGCLMSDTIGQVKDKITASYPTKPRREQQKLIYAGKLLPDNIALKLLFKHPQDVYVMHLVCPLPPIPTSAKKSDTMPTVYSTPSHYSPNVFSQMNQPLLSSPDLTRMPIFPAYPNTDPTQQYMAMQQMYAQFMTQYFAQYNGNFPHANVPSATPVQQAQNAAPPQNPAPVADHNQPEEDVDWLDIIYDFLRGTVLVMLVGYYSSFTRVFGVLVTVLLVSMIARCISNKRQANVRQSAENRASQARTEERERAPNDASQSSSEDNQNEENNASNNDTSNSEASSTETQVPTARPSVMPTIMSFVTTFFTSLIPSDPLPVNAN